MKEKTYLVLNKHRGIYWGVIKKQEGQKVWLTQARHCYSYPRVEGHEGTYGLATYGPGPGARVGPVCTTWIADDVVNIVECTEEAAERWRAAKWG